MFSGRKITIALLACRMIAGAAASAEEEPVKNRPVVAGVFELHVRDRRLGPAGAEKPPVTRPVQWKASETAIIICDMWDDHYCKSAAQRVGVMVPKMNHVITAARNHGAMIIHAPSGTTDVFANTPYRKRMQQAKTATPPVPIEPWCHLDKAKEPEIPIDVSKCPCDDPVVGKAVKVFSRQHPGLDVIGYDGVSDSGVEIYNWCRENGIRNIAIMGVHTNMCVLGRPFGIRQLTRLGMNVVLVRDLTDAMYDPREPPYVSHTRGTELVVEHIERYWCGSIDSADLTRVVANSSGPEPPPAKPAAGP